VEIVLKKAGCRPSHIEGYQAAEWVLLDYVDFVVHVFLDDRRKFYNLEKLWSDAPRVEVQATPLPPEEDTRGAASLGPAAPFDKPPAAD
jgi:hypothetical protein